MKTENQKRSNAIPYTSDQEILLPADTGQSFAISARDWKKLRIKAESLSPTATKWELAFSVSVSVFISFLISALSMLGAETTDKSRTELLGNVYWLVTAFSLGITIVTFIGMKQQKTTFKTDKEGLLHDMSEIQEMYPENEINNDAASESSTNSIYVSAHTPIKGSTYAEYEYDALYNNAKAVALEKGTVSTSFLQRKLRIGYARAARIVEQMEQDGFAAPADGAKPRALLKTDKEF